MIAVLDANFIAILLSSAASVPIDPATQRPYERARDRVGNLIETLQNTNTRILIPAPALGEFLILAHPFGATYVAEIRNSYRFEIAEFDELAAIELSELSVRVGKPKKIRRGEQTWAKLKYDRQIVAIAVARGARSIYSTDKELRKLAETCGVEPFDLCNTPLPPPKQNHLFEPSVHEKANTATEEEGKPKSEIIPAPSEL